MSGKRFQTFEEFWPFYVRAHSQKATRIAHFVGTTAAMTVGAAFAVTRKPWLLALMPVVGYAPAWASHFFIEKNRPATFTYPLWSLRADFVMWGKMVTDTMDGEVAPQSERVAGDREREAPGARDRHGENGAAVF